MKRVILALLLCLGLAQSASAQLMLLGVGPGGAASGGGGFTGLIDVVSGPKALYSLRAGSAAIAAAGTQKLVNIERASDTHSCDVLVAAGGGMGNTANCGTGGDNGQSASSFCNATTCVVSTWYDQSGNGYNATSAGANRPTLTFSCLGSLPCLAFSGSTIYMNVSATTTNQALSFSAVAQRTGNFTTQNDILTGSTGFFFNNAANQAGVYFGSTGGLGSMSVSDNAWHAMELGVTAGTMTYNADGSSTGTASVGSSAFDANFGIGAPNGGGGQYMTGYIAEATLYATDFSASNGALCHNQNVYYSLGKAC